MKSKDTNNEEKKNNNSGEIFQSKRSTWNSRRRYNYKYITTVF
ncbi:hypothetical protein [Polaribacter litorisediminis]|nr:hypothetical protein [Polaribacter litorisediminis]